MQKVVLASKIDLDQRTVGGVRTPFAGQNTQHLIINFVLVCRLWGRDSGNNFRVPELVLALVRFYSIFLLCHFWSVRYLTNNGLISPKICFLKIMLLLSFQNLHIKKKHLFSFANIYFQNHHPFIEFPFLPYFSHPLVSAFSDIT